MRSHSLPSLGDKQRRLARQPSQALGRVRHSGHRAAEVGMQVIDDCDARQELGIVSVEVREQRADEVIMQLAGAR